MLKVLSVIFVLFIQIILVQIILVQAIFGIDSLFVRNIYFHDYKTKQFVYNNKTLIEKGVKVDSLSIYRDIKRLYEETIFSNIRVVALDGGDSIDIHYYPTSIVKYSFLPQVHLLGYADTSMTSVSMSGRFRVKNIFGNNGIYEFYLENAIPVGYSNDGINRISGYNTKSFYLNMFNESLTNKNFIFGIKYSYFFQNSMKIKDDKAIIHSIDGNIGKKLSKYNSLNVFSGVRFYDYVNSVEKLDFSYPYFSVNYSRNMFDYSYFTNFKNYFSFSLTKYGSAKFKQDYYRLDYKMSIIRNYFGYRFLVKDYFSSLFNVNKVTDNMLLYSGGAQTNRGYYYNSLPYFTKRVDGKIIKQGARSDNLFSFEVKKKLFKLGPYQNFFLNYMTSIFEMGLFFDDSYMISYDKKESMHYYSYGIGFFVWPVTFYEFAGFYLAKNRYNQTIYSIITTFNF